MVEIYWEGLTPELQARVTRENKIDLTQLRPSDVTRVAHDHPLEVDWSTILFIKNFRTENQETDTVIWTASEGFYRTQASPNELLTELSNVSAISWRDMKTELGYLKLSGPIPFVIGPTMLVSTERPLRGNNVSWVGGQAVRTVRSAGAGRVQVVLTNGVVAIFHDTATRLRKKLDEVQTLQNFEQQRRHLADSQNDLVYGRTFDQTLLAYPVYRDQQLLWAAFKKTGYQMGLNDIAQLLREISVCDPRSWHLTDER